MKKFFFKSIQFIGYFVIFFIILFYLNRVLSNKVNLFKLTNEKHVLILGDSHTKYSLNDDSLSSFSNFSDDADSYFYSYIKLKQITYKNPQIDTLILSIGLHNIDQEIEERWLMNDKHINNRFRKYASLMDFSEIEFLVSKKPLQFISNIPSILFYPGYLLLQGDKIYGGYSDLKILNYTKAKTNHILDLKKDKADVFQKSKLEIYYLNKIIKFCQTKKIGIILISTPLSPIIQNDNEQLYQLYREEFSDIPYLNMSNIYSDSTYYGDLVHLNKFGAEKFTLKFKTKGLSELLSTYGFKSITSLNRKQ